MILDKMKRESVCVHGCIFCEICTPSSTIEKWPHQKNILRKIYQFSRTGVYRSQCTSLLNEPLYHCLRQQTLMISANVWKYQIHMTGASTNPKKLILKMTWIAWLIVWKYSPISLFLIQPSELFGGLGSGSKTFFGPSYEDNQLRLWKYSPIFCC